MIEFTASEISAYYEARVPAMAQPDKREWRGPCPVHNGTGLNFAVQSDTGRACCHSQCGGRGWDVISLEMELAGSDFPTAKAAVFSLVGRPAPAWEDRDVEAIYPYSDERGELRFQVLRKYGKKFVQRRPDGGGWAWNLKGITPLPYRLPELIASPFAAITEGEKDADALRRIGITATCNNGGAGKFSTQLARWFTGKHVAIFPDFDVPGREHALKVAEILSAVATTVKIVELPGLPPKGDVSDWLAAGGAADQLRELYRKAPAFSDTFDFAIPLASPAEGQAQGDKYLHTFQGEIDLAGGVEKFWNLPAQEGIPTPWPRLTRALGGGMRNGEVYVLGGNQGSGKTSLVLQFALAVLRAHLGVLHFSMEMLAPAVFQRMAAIEARVDLLDLRDLQKSTVFSIDLREMNERLFRETREQSQFRLKVSTKSAVTPEFVLEEASRIRSKARLDMVIVDHMQLTEATGNVRGDYERFTKISRTMKQIAMELDLPVLLVSQASRNNTTDKRAELDVSDLRGSGAIEEDAAACMLLYEDKKDSTETKQAGTYPRGPVKTWLKLGENRYGLQGMYMPLFHSKKYTRFDVATEEAEERAEVA